MVTESPSSAAAAVSVVVYRHGLSLADRRVVRVACPESGVTVREAAMRGLAGGDIDPAAYCASVDGRTIVEVGSEERLGPGQSLVLVPRVGGTETLVMLAIAVVSAAASAMISTRVRLPGASDATTPDTQRFYFNSVSTGIEAGEAEPVVFGNVRNLGLRRYQVEPIEASDGSGDDRLRILFTCGHGEIGGFGSLTSDQDNVDAATVTGIYFNDGQPISTLRGARLWARMGTADQAVVPGFADVVLHQEVGVGGTTLENTSGTEITGGSPGGEEVTITTANAVDAVRVRVRLSNGLYETPSGTQTQLAARTVKWRVRTREYDNPGTPGAWTAWTVVTVTKAQSSRFYSALRIDNLYGDGPHVTQVQVERVSIDAGVDTIADTMAWESLINITYDDDQNYGGYAVLGVELTASEQVSEAPEVTADVAGVKCRIWDKVGDITDPGTSAATRATTGNVAAVIAELVTNPVWGGGDPDSRVWRDSLAELWLRCDETVALRSGSGTRARFVVNTVLNAKAPLVDVVRSLASVAWADAAKVSHDWLFVCDREQTAPVEVFGDEAIALDANGVAAAVAEYENTEGVFGTRPNQWVAQFANEDEAGRTDTIVYPSDGTLWLAADWPEGQEPPRQESVRVDGQTNAEQVIDYLVYIAKRERDLDHSVAFETTRPVVKLMPGERFDLAWSMPGWGTASGRVADGCTTETVILDRDVTLEDGEEYTVQVTHHDGVEEARVVASSAGTYPAGTVLAVTPAFTDAPEAMCSYAIGQTGIVHKPFRCTGIEFVSAPDQRLRVKGVAYDAEVYDRDLAVATLEPYSSLVSIFRTPGPMQTLTARLVNDGDRTRAELSWSQRPEDAAITGSTRIYYRLGGTSTWIRQPVESTTNRSAVFEVDEEQSFEFIAVAVSHAGFARSPYDPAHPIAGINMTFGGGSGGVLPPPASGSLTFDAAAGTYTLEWDAVEGAVEYQVLVFGDPSALPNNGAEDCLVLDRTSATSISGLVLASGEDYVFYIRSVGSSGRLSWTALEVDVDPAGTPTGKTIKATDVFDLSTDGTATDCTWNGTTGRLEMDNPATPAVWTSGEVDTGSSSAGRIAVRLRTANDWESSDDANTSDIEDLAFAIPSIEADQFGAGSTGGEVVMLMPPYDTEVGDGAQGWSVRVRTKSGGVWSSWSSLAHCAGHAPAAWQQYEVEVTLTSGAVPYRPGLRGVTVVVTH